MRLHNALKDAVRQHEQDRAIIADLKGEINEQQREAQHQVRNILSVVRSIVRRTVAEGETAENYQAMLDSRLASFTRLQSNILRNAAGGVNLYNLVADELLAFGIKVGSRAQLEGPDICLHPKPASVLGLAIHELACMAITGRGPADGNAEIDVRWQLEAASSCSSQLSLEWREGGRKVDFGSGSYATFGQEYLEQAISYELNGEVCLDISAGVLICRLLVPAEGMVIS